MALALVNNSGVSCDSIYAVRMWYGSGSGDGKNREHRTYECLIPLMRCGSGTACGGVAAFFPHYGVSRAAAERPPLQKVAWSAFLPIFLFQFLDSYQQLPKFPRASNCNEGQLRKTELMLYEVVIGTVFRPFFYGIVQSKALLSFGSSLKKNIKKVSHCGSIAISSCSCMKTA